MRSRTESGRVTTDYVLVCILLNGLHGPGSHVWLSVAALVVQLALMMCVVMAMVNDWRGGK